jgi:aerobic carbon-monoxide dehydrogenase large subunit
VRMHPFGKVTVITGSSPHGQGHATSWSQIIETELGIPFDDVEVIHGDTAFAPYGLGTYGSRSLAVGGTAVHLAATQVRDKARLVAAQMLEASSDDLDFEGGTFSVKGSPDKSVTMQEVAFRAWQAFDMPEGVTPGLDETVFFDPPNCVFPFGAHGCEVEVDKETGKVEITSYIAVDDCGNVINPMIVDGMVHGGIAQGVAQALYEYAAYDSHGQLQSGSMMDYALPKADDLVSYETDRTVTPSPVNPMGIKGAGETGTIASTAAVANAVMDALAPLGISHLDMPLTPARIWAAIQAKKH